ncbi:MAG TPA: hypothetical protein PKO09_15265 [Anaerolineae bacterium]|nr:hypothetical protein [Anaerolineae bacterium]
MQKNNGGGVLGLILLAAGACYGFYYVAWHPIRSTIGAGNLASSIAWAIFLVLAATAVGYFLIAWISTLRSRQPSCAGPLLLAFVTSALLVGGIYAHFYFGPLHLRPAQAAYWRSVGGVCEGTGVPDARAYSPGQGVHKVEALEPRATASWPWTRHLPKDWRPASLDEMELVLCLEAEEKARVEVCKYSGNREMERFQYRRQATLREARTGEVVGRMLLKGSSPATCPAVTSEMADRKGSRVTDDMVIDWLEPYVSP